MIEEDTEAEDEEKRRLEQMQTLSVAAESLQKHLWSVLGIAAIGPIMVAWYVLGANSLMSEKQAPEIIEAVSLLYEEFEVAESGIRAEMAALRTQITSLRLDTTELNIKQSADLLYDNEAQYQLFLRLLKVNAYSLGDHIFGVHSWFERYGSELDGAIARSEARQMKLLRIRQYYKIIAEAAPS